MSQNSNFVVYVLMSSVKCFFLYMLSISVWGYNVYVALCPEGQACALGMQIASWLCVAQTWWFWTPVSSGVAGTARILLPVLSGLHVPYPALPSL